MTYIVSSGALNSTHSLTFNTGIVAVKLLKTRFCCEYKL